MWPMLSPNHRLAVDQQNGIAASCPERDPKVPKSAVSGTAGDNSRQSSGKTRFHEQIPKPLTELALERGPVPTPLHIQGNPHQRVPPI